MKGIILAAGRGSRVNKLTKKCTKALIKIDDKPLLYYQIKAFEDAGITKEQISIVTGYKKKEFKKFKVKMFYNKNWKYTNMVYSLNKANNWLNKYNCIVSYGDIIYDSDVIKSLKKNKNKFCVPSNLNWKKYWNKRFNNPLSDLESYKIDKKKFIVEIGKKVKNINNINGQFMGIFKIDPKNWIKTKKKISENNFKISTTELLNKLIKEEKTKIKSLDYKKYWFEIDTFKDYKIANNFFIKFKKKNKC